jgi:hypothetical protein
MCMHAFSACCPVSRWWLLCQLLVYVRDVVREALERECVCEREKEREVLLTITKRLKVGKNNALSGNTASGRSGSSI